MIEFLKTESFKVLFSFLKRNKNYAIIGAVFMIFSVILLLPTPLIMKYLIDKVIPSANVNHVFILLLILLGIILFKSISEFYQVLYFSRYNNLVILKIQKALIHKIQKMPRYLRQKYHTGYLMSRILEDPRNLDGMFAKSIVSLIKDIIVFVSGIVILCYLNLFLFAIAIVLLPLFYYTLKKYNILVQKTSADFYEKQANVSKKVQESIQMIDTFRINVSEKYDQLNVIKNINNKIRAALNRDIVALKSNSISGFISGIVPAIIICTGSAMVIYGNISLGTLIAFNSYIGLLFGPTSRFISSFISIQQSLTAWDRIYLLLKEIESEDDGQIVRNISGDISIQNLSLQIEESKILNNVNIHAKKGQTIAFVGRSGAGKSSTVRALMALEDNYSGAIYFDNVSLREMNKQNLRKQIAYVEQEPQLYFASIYENLLLGNTKAKKEEIVNACKIAGIHDFILELDKGYDTIIDERAVNFSVGQKQRLAIARAIVKNPQIIVLDESTSNLDSMNEKEFFVNLNRKFPDSTKIIIAHNLSLVQYADCIYLFEQGNIIDNGKHSDLIIRSDLYKMLWNECVNNTN